jgi:hypothetical protein
MDGPAIERIRRDVTRAEGFRWMASMLANDRAGRRWRMIAHKDRLYAVPETHDGLAYAAEWTVGAFDMGAPVQRGSDWLPGLDLPTAPPGFDAAPGWSLVLEDPGTIGCLLSLVAETRPEARFTALKAGDAGVGARAPGNPDIGAVGIALALLLLGWPS